MSKPSNTRSEAGRKAAATRAENARKRALTERANKAWVTRRKNAS